MHSYVSLSGETEDIDDNVIVFERILLAKITIIFTVPEATCAHVETAIALLQNYHIGRKLQIFVDLLQKFNNNLGCVVAPFLCLF